MYAERRWPRSARPEGRAVRRLLQVLPILGLLPAVPASAQWTTESPAPTHLDARGVGAPTVDHVFVATDDDSFDDGGALFESTDGGATWVQRDVPASLGDPLNGLFFLDSLNGWVYGNANYRTTDGGATWTELPSLGSVSFMKFYTPSFGIATGNIERYVSHDGGTTWEPSPSDVFAFDFADDQLGLGVADSALVRTTDGGATFTEVLAADGDGSAVAFLSSSVAVAIVDGSFVRSTDGGVTWTTGADAEGRTRLVAVSEDVALAWGRSGAFPNYDDRMLRSDDGGQTWSDLGVVFNDLPFAFTLPAAQTLVAADRTGSMFRSTDGGASWTETFSSPGPTPTFLSSAVPAFADAQTGYFAYGPGFVIKTTNGGVSWSQVSSGTGRSLNDIARFEGGDLIAVGENGTLLTKSGTGPWTLHEALSTAHLEAVQVIGTEDAVVVDASARVYHSADGGATWTAAASTPPNLSATDLHFESPLDGWVVGSGFGAGALFHTTDGGVTWTPVTEFAGNYVAVDFEGASGWAQGSGDRFYRSTDGGASWAMGELPGQAFSMNDIEFFDAAVGYAVGGFGYAAATIDGGLTWQVLPTPSTNLHLTDIHLLGANELWVSTTDDVAYHSATGGLSWSVLEIGSDGFGSFAAITGVPGGDAWTAGFQGYIERFDGPPPPPVNQPPAASFTFEASGLSVDFTDMSSDPDGTIVSWEWAFGDSTFSSEQNPSHTYASANTYIARLTVTDDDGDTGTAGRIVTVQPNPGGTFGDFTEVTPLDPLFVTPQDEDFWVATTAPADYDGDGDLDIAVLGFYVVYGESVEERLVLLRNDGEAGPGEWEIAYVDVPLGDLSTGASDLAWGDADGDGDQDLALGTDGETVMYRNDAGTLVLTDTQLPGYWEDNDQADFDLRSITWADYDNDGDQDLLLPSVFDGDAFAYRTKLMRNDGENGTGGWVFTEADSVFAPTGHAQSQWADFDGDEDLDLLLVHLAPLTDDGFIRRYRNDGDGVFVGEDILGSLTIEHGEAQWGDYDADGDLDILVAGHIKETDGSFNRVLRIYRNDAETYVPIPVIACISCEGWFDLTAAAWADYDSDGDIDILLTGTYNSGSQIEGRARIYANDGGVFTDSGNDLPAPRASGTRGGTFGWLDIDGEGDLDYFIAGEYFVPGGNGLIEAQMHLYRNDAEGQNLRPEPPLGLVANVDETSGAVLLSWNAGTDDLTATDALTYDLDVYNSGVAVAAPHRLPQPGNVSATTEWVLAGLPEGIYKWTLRTVDSAYNGSTVVEGEFNVGNVVAVDPPAGAPRAYAFQQNHPNPFNPATTFSFALPERAHVELTVFDPIGRLVTRILSETREAGLHQVRWNATGIASGTYFVRLSTDAFTQTRTVQLLK